MSPPRPAHNRAISNNAGSRVRETSAAQGLLRSTSHGSDQLIPGGNSHNPDASSLASGTLASMGIKGSGGPYPAKSAMLMLPYCTGLCAQPQNIEPGINVLGAELFL